MFKKPMSIFVAASVLALMGPAWAQSQVQTELDGRLLRFDQPAVMQGGRVMVPLRGIFESLGADVLFDSATRTIKATKGDRIVELTLGSRQAKINGQMSYLDVPAATMGGRTLVPLRFVSEALGADVRWMPSTRTVALTSSGNSDLSNLPSSQPTPPAASAPQLSNVVHNARGTLGNGDRLVVTANGDSGGQASFDLPGITNGVPMHETTSGHYEGELAIRNGMKVDQGTLVVRLRRGNQEAVMEGPSRISINSGGSMSNNHNNNNNNNNNGNSNGEQFQVTPAEGSVVNTPRPTVHVTMDSGLTQGSARVFLDGNEVTGQASVVGSAVHYVPTSDLASGNHSVSVQAVDRRGRLLKKDWNFSVYNAGYSNNNNYNHNNNYNNNYNNNQPPQVSLTNLSSGANVPAIFNVQGQTSPYSQVQIVAQAQRSLIPGVIGLQSQVASVTRQADAQGRFDIQLNVSQTPVNTPLSLQISASDQQGRTSQSTRLDVTRR